MNREDASLSDCVLEGVARGQRESIHVGEACNDFIPFNGNASTLLRELRFVFMEGRM